MHPHPYPLGLCTPLHAPLAHRTQSKPTQVPFSLALCPRPTHPSDPVATGPLPRPPLHPLTPHLLTHCLTLPLAVFATSAHHPHWPSTSKMYRICFRTLLFVHVCCIHLCVCYWGRGFQQCLMRLGMDVKQQKKICFPCLSSFSLLLANFNSAFQPLYLNMFLSHLSITSFQSIFICMASHSLSQSISVPRKHLCVSR